MRTLDVVLSVLKRCKRRVRIQKRHITDVLRLGFWKLEGLAIHSNQASVNSIWMEARKRTKQMLRFPYKMLERFRRRICYLIWMSKSENIFLHFRVAFYNELLQPIGGVCRNFNPLTGTIRNARLRLVHTFLKKFTSYTILIPESIYRV